MTGLLWSPSGPRSASNRQGELDGDFATFRSLARTSGDAAHDLSDTLLQIPCSKGKRGIGLLPTGLHSMTDFLGAEAARVLAEGRSEAFKRTHLHLRSEPMPALARYSGQPYKTEGVADGLLDAMAHGLHVVILSGGYGLLRAEELIQDYEAPIQRTLSVWRSQIPIVLRDHVKMNGIARTFGTFSRKYGEAIPDHLSEEDWCAVPTFAELGRQGFAMRVVPERVAQLSRPAVQSCTSRSGL
jgi:hypothetical protein